MNSEHGVSLTDYPARPRVHSVITGCLVHAWVCAGDQGRQRWLLPSGCCRPGRRKTPSDAHTAIYGTGPTCPVSAGPPFLWLPVWLLQAHPPQAFTDQHWCLGMHGTRLLASVFRKHQVSVSAQLADSVKAKQIGAQMSKSARAGEGRKMTQGFQTLILSHIINHQLFPTTMITVP